MSKTQTSLFFISALSFLTSITMPGELGWFTGTIYLFMTLLFSLLLIFGGGLLDASPVLILAFTIPYSIIPFIWCLIKFRSPTNTPDATRNKILYTCTSLIIIFTCLTVRDISSKTAFALAFAASFIFLSAASLQPRKTA